MNNETNITPVKKKNGLNKKYLKIGSFSLTMTAVVIAVVIAVNLFVSEIPSTYTKYDMSALNLFSISDETEVILNGVSEDVTFYILTQRGNEDANIRELLGRYEAMNSRISVKTVDPITNPAFIEQYTSETLYDNSVIVVSDKRSYPIDYNEIYPREYSEEEIMAYYYYGQMPQGTPYFSGELMFSTGLDYVTRDDLPTLYTLTGHGETALTETYLGYLSAENIAHAETSLLTLEALPDDCSSVLINNPTSDLSSMETELLTGYLGEGGNVILVTGAVNFDSAKMPNLTALAKTMGLEPLDGIVIETGKNNYMMYPHYLLPALGSTVSGPLSLLTNDQIYVLANAAHGIVSDGTKDVIPLLSTTTGAYVKKDLNSQDLAKADGDIEGLCYIGAAVTEEADGTRGEEGKFVWFSSPALTDEAADQWVSGGDSAVFMAAANWMSENKTSLSIMAKQLQVEALTLTAAQSGFWSVIVVFVLPLACFALGFVIWFRRRKK